MFVLPLFNDHIAWKKTYICYSFIKKMQTYYKHTYIDMFRCICCITYWIPVYLYLFTQGCKFQKLPFLNSLWKWINFRADHHFLDIGQFLLEKIRPLPLPRSSLQSPWNGSRIQIYPNYLLPDWNDHKSDIDICLCIQLVIHT